MTLGEIQIKDVTGPSTPAWAVPASEGTGRDGTGLDGTGLDGTGLDGTGLDGTGLDGTGLDGTGLDGTGLDVSGRVPAQTGIELGLAPPSLAAVYLAGWVALCTVMVLTLHSGGGAQK